MGFRQTNRTPNAPDLQRNAFAEDAASAVIAASTTTAVNTAYPPPVFLGDSGEDGEPGPPGVAGMQGLQGATGPQGAIGLPGFDGADGFDSMVPGPQGAMGAQGAVGPPGPIGLPGLPGEDGEDGWTVPGPQGAQGPAGGGGLTLLATLTTSAGQTSATLASGISGSYRNLVIQWTAGSASTSTTTSDQLGLQFNGDTGGHYGGVVLFTWNSSNSVAGDPNTGTNAIVGVLSATGATGVSSAEGLIRIYNYTDTSTQINFNSQSAGYQSNVGVLVSTGGGRWNPTSLAAITSIVVLNRQGTAFKTGSVFKLYGES